MTKFIFRRVTFSDKYTIDKKNGSKWDGFVVKTPDNSSQATSNSSTTQPTSQSNTTTTQTTPQQTQNTTQTTPQTNNNSSSVANEANNVAKETNTVAKEAGTVAKEAGEAENVAKTVAKSGGFKRTLSFMNRNKGKMLLGGLALGGLATLWAGHKAKKYVTGGMGDKNSGVRNFNGRYVY